MVRGFRVTHGRFGMLFLKKVMGMVSEASLKGVKLPDYELEEGEKVVGTLSDDLKKLYVVMLGAKEKTKALHDRLEKEISELGDNIPKGKKKAIVQEHAMVHLEEDLIESAFWTCVRLEFPEVGSDDVGLRQDWQVVHIDPKAKAKKALGELLEHFFR